MQSPQNPVGKLYGATVAIAGVPVETDYNLAAWYQLDAEVSPKLLETHIRILSDCNTKQFITFLTRSYFDKVGVNTKELGMTREVA